MNHDFVRVLLLDRGETTVRVLRDCFAQLLTRCVDLHWVATRGAALNALLSAAYDVYLLEGEFIDGREQDILPMIIELGRRAPAIALVETAGAGRRALELGAADYWQKDQLNLDRLEPSLRLTLEIGRCERQLARFNRDRQLAEHTWQENEGAFQISEERLHEILESLDDAIWSFEPRHNKLLYLNSAVESVYGYTVNDFFKDFSLWRAPIHPADRQRVEACDNRANGSSEGLEPKPSGFDIDYRIIHRDGSLRWLRERTRVIYDRQGRVVRRNSIASDITARKQAEDQLQQQIERERLLARLTQELRSSLDLDEILNTAVREARNFLQCDRALIVRLTSEESGTISHEAVAAGIDSILGVQFESCSSCGPEHCPYARRGVVAVEDSGGAEPGCELQPLLQTLKVRSHLVVPILQPDTPWGLLVLHQCHRKRQWQTWEIELLQQLAAQIAIALYQAQLLEEQTRYARELARSNQELEQFAYIASHDLQEPLRAVISFAQLLEQDYGDRLEAEAQEYIEFIVEGATRMRQLIQDLLALSRVGTRGREFAPTDCQRAVEQALDNLRMAIAESNAIIAYDSLPTLMADESQLVQLFQNTIANAIKFRSERQPEIKIQAVLEPALRDPLNLGPPPSNPPHERDSKTSLWRFSVRDNGIGIEEKYRDRIFEIFQRLHSREQYEGTGIGLALCQKIVQRHGGRIWVESIPGQGSTFYFTLCGETR